jgi:hypothetical protein
LASAFLPRLISCRERDGSRAGSRLGGEPSRIAFGACSGFEVETLLSPSAPPDRSDWQANAQADRVATLERESEKKLAELREQMETHVSTELAAAAAEYRPARILGAAAVVVGLGLATSGNFIG